MWHIFFLICVFDISLAFDTLLKNRWKFIWKLTFLSNIIHVDKLFWDPFIAHFYWIRRVRTIIFFPVDTLWLMNQSAGGLGSNGNSRLFILLVLSICFVVVYLLRIERSSSLIFFFANLKLDPTFRDTQYISLAWNVMIYLIRNTKLVLTT